MKYKYKTQPRPFQRRALKRAVEMGRLLLWMPMRSGKTKVAVDWASVLHLKYGVKRILVVTHSPTTFGVWRNEFAKHCPITYDLVVQDLDHEWIDNGSEPKLNILVTNVQRVYERDYPNPKRPREWEVVDNRQLYEWDPQVVIVDEATCIGDPGSRQAIHLNKLLRKLNCQHRLLLTGTPLHRSQNIFGAFGIFKTLNEDIFGTALGAYKQQYGLWGGYNKTKLLKRRNMKRWRSKIAPWVYQMRYVPYREPVHQVIPVELSTKTLKAYTEMWNEMVTTIKGQSIIAPITLTMMLKCAQIAAGHIRDEQGVAHRVGTELKDSLEAHMSSLRDSDVKRVVLFARFIPELRDAALACNAAGYKPILFHGKVSAYDREQRIAEFHDPGEFKVFISQISTGSMGIDLSCADTTVFYTLTESLLHYDQAMARMRVHADKRALTYYYLIPQGTMLETMYLALKGKMDLTMMISKHPELIDYEEAG